MTRSRRAAALLAVLLASSAVGIRAQVLTQAVNTLTGGTGNLINGVGNAFTSLTQPNQQSAVLPSCARSNVLHTTSGFPSDWAKLSAQQQAAHPINLPLMQLAYSPFEAEAVMAPCLAAMGISATTTVSKVVPQYAAGVTARVLRAGTDQIFVAFKASDWSSWGQNLACRHTAPLGAKFNSKADIRLHSGFYSGWAELEADVVAAVKGYLREVPSARIVLTGHSLGAALASIAALRLHTLLPRATIAGVWLWGSPRVGNAAWAALYNAALQPVTLRVTNFQDFAARVPQQQQACVTGVSSSTATFEFRHVGRSLLMCPIEVSGLTSWSVAAAGSEVTSCPGAEGDVDTSIATHLMGSYFDAWRRGLYGQNGNTLASSKYVTSVLCAECAAIKTLTRLRQAAWPARAGGPVTCGVDASCANQAAWNAATAVGDATFAPYSDLSVCNGFLCSPA